jgi:hypothetical protein
MSEHFRDLCYESIVHISTLLIYFRFELIPPFNYRFEALKELFYFECHLLDKGLGVRTNFGALLKKFRVMESNISFNICGCKNNIFPKYDRN